MTLPSLLRTYSRVYCVVFQGVQTSVSPRWILSQESEDLPVPSLLTVYAMNRSQSFLKCLFIYFERGERECTHMHLCEQWRVRERERERERIPSKLGAVSSIPQTLRSLSEPIIKSWMLKRWSYPGAPGPSLSQILGHHCNCNCSFDFFIDILKDIL